MQKYYKIVTFGCQMNVHESEKLAGTLESFGYKETADDCLADVVVINTCCIRETAENKALGNIGKFKPLKKQKKDMVVAVCGCMMQEDKMAKMVHDKFPFVDIIFGTHNSYKFEEYLRDILDKKRKRVFEVVPEEPCLPKEVESYRTSGQNAWVNIMYGCNNFCSYCIVPYVRGREKSRPMQEIVDECASLVKSGYKEITLLGQNVNSYGNTFKNGKNNFAELLKQIDKIDGNYILRFMTSHPKDLSEEVVKVIKDSKHISHMIHLPVQSGSDKILKLMNRNYTRQHYLKTIEMIRSYIPDANLSTDIIVGFPGETDEDFNATMELVKEVKYNMLFAFIYSKRTGTPAEKMPNQVPDKTKRQRINALLSLQRQIEKENFNQYVGKTIKVLLSGRRAGKAFGKTDCGINVIVENLKDFKLDFVNVKIKDIKNSKLIGDAIDE